MYIRRDKLIAVHPTTALLLLTVGESYRLSNSAGLQPNTYIKQEEQHTYKVLRKNRMQSQGTNQDLTAKTP
jgi:hypothetical protein